jgi:hypothetical protein
MGLDIYFYKTGVDIQKNRDDISDAYRRLQTIKDEMERLENDSVDADLFSIGITHNLNEMAKAIGLYKILWRPEEVGITVASQMISPLEDGIKELEVNPDKYKAYNAPNGFGNYDDLMKFCKSLLRKCRKFPDAVIEASR